MAARRDVRLDPVTMTTSCFLCIDSRGGLRITATPPKLSANEICMKLDVKVPRSIFKKPMLMAEIVVPTEAGNPATIGAKTVDNIKNAVKQATGMELSIVVQP